MNSDFEFDSSTIDSQNITCSIEKLNENNIIINDSDCSDSFIEKISSELEEKGLQFRKTKNCEDVNYDGTIVITLDQQYASGSDTVIFAPFNNTRLGNSDALALGMEASFKKHGFPVKGILCSQVGYIQDKKGNVSNTKPTDTENAIDGNNDASFVTISFGTVNADASVVANCIIEGLARQQHFVENYDSGNDLIYCANSDNKIEVVANYFDSDISELKNFNNIKNNTFVESQPIINPKVGKIDSFNEKMTFKVNHSIGKSY